MVNGAMSVVTGYWVMGSARTGFHGSCDREFVTEEISLEGVLDLGVVRGPVTCCRFRRYCLKRWGASNKRAAMFVQADVLISLNH